MHAGTGAGAANLEFAKGVLLEHTEKAGCDTPFTTSNYGVTTTPRKEYEIVMGGRECPEEDMKDLGGNRVRARAPCARCVARRHLGRLCRAPHGRSVELRRPPASLPLRRSLLLTAETAAGAVDPADRGPPEASGLPAGRTDRPRDPRRGDAPTRTRTHLTRS